jgi:thiol-disulfide isomerase/thioredoxin
MLRIALLAWLTLGVSLGYSAAHETTDDLEEFFERVAARQSVSTDEFSQLSEEEQLKRLRELLLKYRRLTSNISASAKVSVKNLAYDPKTRKVGNEVTDVGRTKHYELRRIGPSYRVTVQQLPLEKKPNVYYPFVIESYDAQAGLRRQLTTLAEEGLPTRHHGSISTKRGRAAEGCLFYQYFGDETARGDVSLADVGTRFLRSCEDAHIGRIDPDKATVDVAFESTTPWGINASCVETFDLSKAGLLVGLRLNEFRNAASGRVETHRYTLSMPQPAEVDGVWIPTRLQLYAWSARQPEKITVHEGVMSDIRLNKLTAKDLEVAFPVGTKVSDQHTGARHEVGERGQQVPLLDGSEIVDKLKNRIQKMVGRPAPPLPQDGWIGGTPPDTEGQPYLIHFWATWCGSCKGDFPILKEMAENGARIIGLHPAGTPVDQIARVMEQSRIGYPTWVASQGESRGSGGTIAGFPSGVFPYCILVDAHGNVAAHGFFRDVLAKFRALREAAERPERR